MLSIPNALCLIRLILAPLVAICLLKGRADWAAFFFVFGAITDAIDGPLARAWGQVSVLGQRLDPVADKALINSAFLASAYVGAIPWWLALIILARDLLILTGAALTKGLALGHDLLPLVVGKVTTALQMVYLGLLLLSPLAPAFEISIGAAFEFVVAIVSILSGVLYTADWVSHLRKRSAL